MKKLDHFLDHGNHNEHACFHLLIANPDLTDWVITTAFYSALQFVSYKIFPLQVDSIEGKKTSLNDISQYSSYSNPKRLSRHELLDGLVYKHCPEISEDYSWLMSLSMTARYSNYQQPKQLGRKAINLMQKIKKYCTSSK
jgi:hypothetical protein